MEGEAGEEALSEAEIDVCSIDVEDYELDVRPIIPNCNGFIWNRRMGRINGPRKESCSSPDADSGIDEKVTGTEKVIKPKDSAMEDKINTLRKARCGSESISSSPDVLGDHDYPVREEESKTPLENPEAQLLQALTSSQNDELVPERETLITEGSFCNSSVTSAEAMMGSQGTDNSLCDTSFNSSTTTEPLEEDSIQKADLGSLATGDGKEACCSRVNFVKESHNKSCTNVRKRQREECKIDENACNEDSDDERLNNTQPDPFNRFYFESDHLALKHNRDYQRLLKTLVILEGQRTQALKDLGDLEKWREKAIENPIEFVENLRKADRMNFPQRQIIPKLPVIDWGTYLAHCTGNKAHYDMYLSTRASISKFGQGGLGTNSIEANSKGSKLCRNEDVLETDINGSKFVRGRLFVDSKPATFNQLWTTEEQEKLEKLLRVYPPEDVESRRWEKIARALGNRTPKQVASRVQKYFIKLAKAGLPVPGRLPTLQRKTKVNPVSFRNSTFFPSWRPHINMPDDDDESMFDSMECDASETFSHISDPVSDDEEIPAHLKETDEYKEYIRLIKLKRERESEIFKNVDAVHQGFRCDKCGMEPIIGTRWHCIDCSPDDLDLCCDCVGGSVSAKNHFPEHNLKAFKQPDITFIDGDYVKLSENKGRYNYLDPNFRPLNDR